MRIVGLASHKDAQRVASDGFASNYSIVCPLTAAVPIGLGVPPQQIALGGTAMSNMP